MESCNQDDPKEAFQWALISLPFAGSTPLIVQPEVRPEWSQLFWDLGFRHHPDLQVKKIIPPVRGQLTSLNGSAMVVGMDEEPPEGEFIQDPASMTPYAAEMQLELHRRNGTLKDWTPEGPEGASVVQGGDLFDPAKHTAAEVNVYLSAPIPHAEKMRVMAAEMARPKGPRQHIMRKHGGI